MLTFINCRTMTGTLSCFYRWLNCLMPDTSSYLTHCRSFLRAWGVDYIACRLLEKCWVYKAYTQVCQGLWYTCLFRFFFLFLERTGIKNISCIPELSQQKGLQGCWELTEMVKHLHRIRCMADFYVKHFLSGLCALLFWKISVVIILPIGRILCLDCAKYVGCSTNHIL